MARPRILIVYGSSFGQTARIADRIAEVLRANGIHVSLQRGDRIVEPMALARFDGVIIGASVIRERHQSYIEEFVTRHRAELNRMPSAFFSVCASVASPNERIAAGSRRYVDAFLTRTGWQPDRAITVAGAVAYRRYNLLLRLVVRRISAQSGMATDTSRNHEYTDWTQVVQFARDVTDIVCDGATVVALAQ